MHSKRLLFIVWPCVDWLFARRPRLLHLIYASSHTQCTTSVIPFIHLFRFTSTTSAMLFNYDATHRLHFMMSICILHSQTSLFVLFFFFDCVSFANACSPRLICAFRKCEWCALLSRIMSLFHSFFAQVKSWSIAVASSHLHIFLLLFLLLLLFTKTFAFIAMLIDIKAGIIPYRCGTAVECAHCTPTSQPSNQPTDQKWSIKNYFKLFHSKCCMQFELVIHE